MVQADRAFVRKLKKLDPRLGVRFDYDKDRWQITEDVATEVVASEAPAIKVVRMETTHVMWVENRLDKSFRPLDDRTIEWVALRCDFERRKCARGKGGDEVLALNRLWHEIQEKTKRELHEELMYRIWHDERYLKQAMERARGGKPEDWNGEPEVPAPKAFSFPSEVHGHGHLEHERRQAA